jgi:hypothetical protein
MTRLITPSGAIGLALASATFLALAVWFAERHSITYDETVYLDLSIRSARDGRLDPAFMTLGTAPLPMLLTYAPPILAGAKRIEQADVWQGRDAPVLIRAPRLLNAAVVGAPLIITVFLWLYRRRGPIAATLGGGLAALSPTFLAHGGLATTDASLALFGTLGAASIAWCASAPGTGRLLLAALAVAAAMSAKYSGLYLLAVAPVVFLLSSIRRQREEGHGVVGRRVVREAIVYGALLAVLTLPLWWGAHLFGRLPPDDPSNLSLSSNRFPDYVATLAPIVGLQRQIQHNADGADAFLMGERSESGQGWWYYFPIVFLIKSTPAELALAVVLLAALAFALRHPWRMLTRADSSVQCWVVAACVLIAMLVSSHLNGGHRYMIPIYPLLIIAASDFMAAHLADRRALFSTVAIALLALQVWSSASVAPHFLSYVNRFAGGPENGWRLLADSSLDWGQDLPELRAMLQSRSPDRVAMRYFGTALPEAYGVDADDIEHLKAAPEDYRWLALSATYLNGLHMSGGDPFKDFRSIEPDAQAGHSIMLYELRRPEAAAAFRAAVQAFRH